MNLDNRNHPKYEPEKWNKDKYIRKTHNCYAYALNLINKDYAKLCKKYMNKTKKHNCHGLRPQPGQYSGFIDEHRGIPYRCTKINRRLLRDNPSIKKIRNLTQKCPKNYYKIALVHSNNDYHFYREDNNGLWSHKDGWRKATNKDAKGRLIKDPKKADRGKYKTFCGYYIAPISKNLKK